MPTAFLTSKERQEYDAVPDEISRREIVQYFTLSPDDLVEANKCRGEALCFGFALQLCHLRWPGRFPEDMKAAPAVTLGYLSEQLDLSSQMLDEYSEQGHTGRAHRERIRQHLRYREFKHTRKEVATWLLALALGHDFARGLMDALIEHLRREKIVRPGISSLERFVTQVRNQASAQVRNAIEQQLTEVQRQALDALLEVSGEQTASRLQWLKAPPSRATAKSLLEWLKKVEVCRSLGADHLDLSDLHPNRVKLLARRARRKSNTTIASTDAPERYALLTCFLYEALYNLTDQTIEMHSQLIRRIFRRAERKRDKEFAKQGKTINEKVLLLGRIGQVILNESEVADAEVRKTIYQRVSRERLAQAIAECSALAQPSDFNSLAYAVRSCSYLRQFVSRFLAVMRFHSAEESNPLLKAVVFMRQVNAGGCPVNEVQQRVFHRRRLGGRSSGRDGTLVKVHPIVQ